MALEELPRRPGVQACKFYLKNGSCKFGSKCRYNHPAPKTSSVKQPGNSSQREHHDTLNPRDTDKHKHQEASAAAAQPVEAAPEAVAGRENISSKLTSILDDMGDAVNQSQAQMRKMFEEMLSSVSVHEHEQDSQQLQRIAEIFKEGLLGVVKKILLWQEELHDVLDVMDAHDPWHGSDVCNGHATNSDKSDEPSTSGPIHQHGRRSKDQQRHQCIFDLVDQLMKKADQHAAGIATSYTNHAAEQNTSQQGGTASVEPHEQKSSTAAVQQHQQKSSTAAVQQHQQKSSTAAAPTKPAPQEKETQAAEQQQPQQQQQPKKKGKKQKGKQSAQQAQQPDQAQQGEQPQQTGKQAQQASQSQQTSQPQHAQQPQQASQSQQAPQPQYSQQAEQLYSSPQPKQQQQTEQQVNPSPPPTLSPEPHPSSTPLDPPSTPLHPPSIPHDPSSTPLDPHFSAHPPYPSPAQQPFPATPYYTTPRPPNQPAEASTPSPKYQDYPLDPHFPTPSFNSTPSSTSSLSPDHPPPFNSPTWNSTASSFYSFPPDPRAQFPCPKANSNGTDTHSASPRRDDVASASATSPLRDYIASSRSSSLLRDLLASASSTSPLRNNFAAAHATSPLRSHVESNTGNVGSETMPPRKEQAQTSPRPGSPHPFFVPKPPVSPVNWQTHNINTGQPQKASPRTAVSPSHAARSQMPPLSPRQPPKQNDSPPQSAGMQHHPAPVSPPQTSMPSNPPPHPTPKEQHVPPAAREARQSSSPSRPTCKQQDVPPSSPPQASKQSSSPSQSAVKQQRVPPASPAPASKTSSSASQPNPKQQHAPPASAPSPASKPSAPTEPKGGVQSKQESGGYYVYKGFEGLKGLQGFKGAAAQGATKNIEPSKEALERARIKSLRLKTKANELHKRKHFQLAEDEYGKAIKELENLSAASVTLGDSLLPELSVLYSNRAGTRLMRGNVQAALDDSIQSTNLDPTFTRAYGRACTCYVRLGRVEEAEQHLGAGLGHVALMREKRKEMQQKQKELAELLLLRKKLLDSVHVEATAEQLQKTLSDCSTVFEEMRDCQLMKDVHLLIQLRCGLFSSVLEASAASEIEDVCTDWWLRLQVKYHEGGLDEALALAVDGFVLLASNKEGRGAKGANQNDIPTEAELESIVQNIKQLLSLKQQGNEAVGSSRWQEAVTKYTAALALNPPLPFSAVLHCNRSLAYQNLKMRVESLADAGRAKALNPTYVKAYQRLANQLSTMNRAAVSASVLASMSDHCSLGIKEKLDVHVRVSDARRQSNMQKTPDHYQFLDLARDCCEGDVRKAYKKMALRFHPDKALSNCKFSLQLGQSGVKLALGAEVVKRLREESSSLFSFIGQAHEELADPASRRKVDRLLDDARNSFSFSTSRPYGTCREYSSYSNNPAYSRSTSTASNSWFKYTRPNNDYVDDDDDDDIYYDDDDASSYGGYGFY